MKLLIALDNQIEELTKMSKAAFDSDVDVGSLEAGGPPDYDNMAWHKQMAKEGHLFAAIENDKLVGGAILFNDNHNRLYIGRILISPEYFKQGLGLKLMACVETLYPECKNIYLDTPIWNVRTNSFYKKLGYKEVRRDKEFVYYEKH